MWRNKNVWIVLIGEFIAGLGLWLGILGNLEFMQKYVPSDFMKSVILFIGLLAGVLVGPMAGRVIDQYEKKSSSLRWVWSSFKCYFHVFAIQFESIAFMIAFMVALQISAAFYFPALQSVIPLIVREHELLQMNGVHMNVGTIARIAGTSLGGILLVVMSLQYMYAFSMAAYALLFLSTFFLQFEDKKSTTPSKQAAKDNSFMEVFRILKGIPIAFTALILSIIPLLFIAGFNLMVINISEMQHDPTIKGFIYTIEGVAFMIGAFVIKRLSDHFKPEKLLYFFAVCTAFAHLSLFFSDIKWMALTSFGLFGFSVGCFFPIMSTIFQTKVEKVITVASSHSVICLRGLCSKSSYLAQAS